MRGLSPYPAAWTEIKHGDSAPVILKIFETEKIFCNHENKPGSIVTDNKTYLHIASTDGYINVLSLQLAGKKRMPVADFLRGFNASGYICIS